MKAQSVNTVWVSREREGGGQCSLGSVPTCKCLGAGDRVDAGGAGEKVEK